MKEMEWKPYSSETMRVRCPDCRKLYLVQYSDIQEAKPRFECVQCHTRFWLSMPDVNPAQDINGIPMQIKEVAPREAQNDPAKGMRPCPKCAKSVLIGTNECPNCGVLIWKMKGLEFSERGLPHSEALTLAWKRVVAKYENNNVHAEFVSAAQRENALPFAAQQYRQLTDLIPSDETAQRQLREIQALAEAMITAPAPTPKGRPSRLWQLPLLVAVFFIGVGVIVPVLRNMAGVGAAFFFLALAVQLQFRRR